MSFSVGSAPMPQADAAAAPAPPTPNTFRKRRRFIPSLTRAPLVVTYAAVPGHLVLHVTVDAPAHAQRRDLFDLSHALDLAVARGAGIGAEGLDVAHVGEAHEPGERMDAHPLRRLALAPRVPNSLDLRLMRRRRAADQLMAAHARLERGNPGLARDRCRVMAVHAGDLVLSRMDVVAEKDRLARPLEVTRVADDGSLITLGRRDRKSVV